MNLLPDDSQQEIIDSTAAFLDDIMPLDRLRANDDEAARPNPAQLTQMAELGWFGLSLPEAAGGIGFSLAEETLLFREIGRRAGSVGLLATAIATRIAAAAEDRQRVEALLAGRLRVGWAEPMNGGQLAGSISGSFQVFDGADADLWVAADSTGAVLMDPDIASKRESRRCLDEFTDLIHADFEEASAIAYVDGKAQIAESAAVLTSAMLAGVAEVARDLASTYAQERFQFGKPIGIFQAIKHLCADMAVRCEASWSQTCYATLALRDGLADAAFQVSAAKSLTGEAATENAAANLQVHGGYGFTIEYDAHVLVKRTHILNMISGTPRQHLKKILDAPPAV